MSVQLEALADDVFEAAGAANQAIANAVRHPFGLVLSAPRFPEVFFLNTLKDLEAPDWSVAGLEAFLHREIPRASYDRVVTRHPPTRTNLERGLLAAGYRAEHKMAMLQANPAPTSRPSIRIVPVADGPTWAAFDTQVEQDWRRWPQSTIRQVIAVFHAFTEVLPDRFYLAMLDGGVVGRVGMLRHRDLGYVHGLAVLPTVRRRGVGTALMRAMEAQARAEGCERIALLCETDSWLPAYYGRLGYIPISEEATWMKPREVASRSTP